MFHLIWQRYFRFSTRRDRSETYVRSLISILPDVVGTSGWLITSHWTSVDKADLGEQLIDLC